MKPGDKYIIACITFVLCCLATIDSSKTLTVTVRGKIPEEAADDRRRGHGKDGRGGEHF